MMSYIVRRFLYAIPIVLGVNIITFVLFFFVNSPDQVARNHLDRRRATLADVEKWKREHGYNLPYFHNDGWLEEGAREIKASGLIEIPALPQGSGRLRLELPAGSGTVRFTLLANPPDAVRMGSQAAAPLPPETKLPDGFGPVGTVEFTLAAQTRTETAEIAVGNPKGAELRLYADLPKDAPRVVGRLFEHHDLSIVETFSQTMFFQKSIKFLWFDFGYADDGRSIFLEVQKRIPPSLLVTLPMFVIGLLAEITIAMLLAYFRGTYLDFWGVVLCVIMMSVSIMFYVIGGQWAIGKALHLAPISGFDFGTPLKFVIMPVVLGAIAGVGSGARWYRTIFLEEVGKDYVRTARMKGLSESAVLYKHALKNAMVPILTSVIVSIPFLFLGALILESFFAIPGMGAFTIEAINRQDFAIVQAMVVLGSYLYILGLIMTDISYTLVDPRVRLK